MLSAVRVATAAEGYFTVTHLKVLLICCQLSLTHSSNARMSCTQSSTQSESALTPFVGSWVLPMLSQKAVSTKSLKQPCILHSRWYVGALQLAQPAGRLKELCSQQVLSTNSLVLAEPEQGASHNSSCWVHFPATACIRPLACAKPILPFISCYSASKGKDIPAGYAGQPEEDKHMSGAIGDRYNSWCSRCMTGKFESMPSSSMQLL